MDSRARYLLLIVVMVLSSSTVLLTCYFGLNSVYPENVEIFVAIGLIDVIVVCMVIVYSFRTTRVGGPTIHLKQHSLDTIKFDFTIDGRKHRYIGQTSEIDYPVKEGEHVVTFRTGSQQLTEKINVTGILTYDVFTISGISSMITEKPFDPTDVTYIKARDLMNVVFIISSFFATLVGSLLLYVLQGRLGMF